MCGIYIFEPKYFAKTVVKNTYQQVSISRECSYDFKSNNFHRSVCSQDGELEYITKCHLTNLCYSSPLVLDRLSHWSQDISPDYYSTHLFDYPDKDQTCFQFVSSSLFPQHYHYLLLDKKDILFNSLFKRIL